MFSSLRPSLLNKSRRTLELHIDTQYQDYHVPSSPVSFSLLMTFGRGSSWIVDDEMRYIPFAKDYGPLNLAYTFEACVAIHTRLNVS
jgi:hypothetical protein